MLKKRFLILIVFVCFMVPVYSAPNAYIDIGYTQGFHCFSNDYSLFFKSSSNVQLNTHMYFANDSGFCIKSNIGLNYGFNIYDKQNTKLIGLKNIHSRDIFFGLGYDYKVKFDVVSELYISLGPQFAMFNLSTDNFLYEQVQLGIYTCIGTRISIDKYNFFNIGLDLSSDFLTGNNYNEGSLHKIIGIEARFFIGYSRRFDLDRKKALARREQSNK